MEKPEIRQRKVPRRLPPGIKPVRKMELFTGKAPDCFEWGWTKMPMVSRFLILGTFFSVVAFAVPYWANIDYDGYSAHFGLFAYCPGELGATCTSIHDNLVPGRDVPLWYHFTQVSYFIGSTCGALGMFVVYSNHEGRYLVIPPTTRRMSILMLTVGVIQLTISTYTFLKYFDHTDFLYVGHKEVNFHGCFYCAIIGTVCYVIGILMLLIDDEDSRPPPEVRARLAMLRRQKMKNKQLQQTAFKPYQEKREPWQDEVAALIAQNKVPKQQSPPSGISWPQPPVETPLPAELPMGQTLVKVVDPDSVFHYTAEDYIVKHKADRNLDLATLARATGGRNYSPAKSLPKDPPPPYTEKDELKLKAEKEKKEQEERKQEERKKREEERKKQEDLPPWVRYHNFHSSNDPHKHCQCIHNHNQQWYPVSAEIIANQPKLGSGPQVKEIL